jgi:hypothetical protein
VLDGKVFKGLGGRSLGCAVVVLCCVVSCCLVSFSASSCLFSRWLRRLVGAGLKPSVM